jgi:hypothetical protein
MTIREYIRRRVVLALATVLAATIAVNIAMDPNVANGNVNPLLAVGAIGLSVIPGALIYLAIHCPKCSTRISMQIANQIAFPLLSKIQGEPIRRKCSSCGANLDQPMPVGLIS